MLIASVNTELYRYEIHSLIKAFYPEEDVKVLVEGAPIKGAGREEAARTAPFMTVHFSEDSLEAALPQAGLRLSEKADKEPFDRKGRECKTVLKHLVYDILSAHTGRQLPWGELIGIRPTKIAMQRLLEGDTKEEAAEFMIREHKASREKALLAADIAGREKEILSGIHYENGYSLYVGIPFCPTTCLYCSFTSFPIGAWTKRVDEYLEALEKEIEAGAALMEGKILDTVYIGGGTPTTLEPDQLERLITALKSHFPMENLQEFTVEAGRPDSITPEKLRVLKEQGVTRISVNPQTMRDETLKLIGRRHSVEQTEEAFRMAREAGFDNINMDIILGLPGENEEDVAYTIDRIRALDPDSLTVHSLAVKRASKLQQWIEKNGYAQINNTDEGMKIAAAGAADMDMKPYYLYRQKNMSGNFENVGYAREGKYGIYNILIMEEKQSILALGAGSISKAVFPGGRIERSDNCKDIDTYISTIDEMIARKGRLYGQTS
jgi:oxygen-independent coproporphyrinogen-3 oxidase